MHFEFSLLRPRSGRRGFSASLRPGRARSAQHGHAEPASDGPSSGGSRSQAQHEFERLFPNACVTAIPDELEEEPDVMAFDDFADRDCTSPSLTQTNVEHERMYHLAVALGVPLSAPAQVPMASSVTPIATGTAVQT